MKHKNDRVFNLKLYGKQRFGFRKLSVGLVAAALGTTLFISGGQLVHADEQKATESSESSQSELSQVEKETNSDQDTHTNSSDHGKSDNDIDAQTGNIQKQDLDAEKLASPSSSGNDTNSEKVESPTISVVTKATDENGKESSTVDPKDTKNMMVGQDTVNVHISLDNLQPTDKTISFHFSNVGNDQAMNFNTHTLDVGTTSRLDDNWNITNTGNGILTTTWINENMDPESLDLIVPLQGNNEVVKKSTDVEVKLTISTKSGNESMDILKAHLTPYKDKVREDEIVKGFAMGETTVAKEKSYNNISEEDIQNTNAQDNQTVLQWGIYFNYGKGGAPDLHPLMDAVFNISFGGNQKLLPSSIRVFQVPNDMILDSEGYRHGEGDPYPGGGSYYDQITKYDNYRPDFVKYLQEHVNGNDISVNQSKDEIFFIPTAQGKKDESYSKHAYFIQIDTLLTTDQTIPGNGETITYQSFNGKGRTIDNGKQSWTSEISGSSTGIAFNKEQAHLTFYDDTIGEFINPKDYHIDITGDPETEINFGDRPDQIYNQLINDHYLFNGVTEGKNAKGILIKDKNGNKVTFASNSIYGNFDDTDNRADNTKDLDPQYFVVHFVHDIETSKETKSLKETINYVDENTGETIHPEYNSSTLTFVRTKTHDKVTRQDTYSDWSLGSLASVENPIIPGYTIDANNISEKLNNHDNNLLAKSTKEIGGIIFTQDEINALTSASLIDVVVPYVKDQIPPTPTPIPSTPSNPTSPTNPEKPSQPSTPVPNIPQTSTVQPKSQKPEKPQIKHTSNNHGKKNTTNVTNIDKKIPSNETHNHMKTFRNVSTISNSTSTSHDSSTKQVLPHTGEKQNKLGLIGLAFMTIATMLGLTDKKRKND
ncbi:hypothetical protein GCM10022297_05190 [Lactobacillus hamsteri]|uniref:Lipase n=1 Tax=Lactobacillus hamsteri DSM 5661 = JCM 6256 TaxID=1423754 RepID=A0A0R1YG23_9LACO|nr:YSIRK signal domain/LPXTG anchor domain surface protein [Lactobacillus hamsteri]KRM41210.1 lipase [Lactobacillus hamsteri DSM 5661 = JCM 6256]